MWGNPQTPGPSTPLRSLRTGSGASVLRSPLFWRPAGHQLQLSAISHQLMLGLLIRELRGVCHPLFT